MQETSLNQAATTAPFLIQLSALVLFWAAQLFGAFRSDRAMVKR
jgi:hypothetical protein